MEYTTVRNNKETDGILKFEKQEVTPGLLESKQREQSDIKDVQNGAEQLVNQFFKEEKTEENVNTAKKPHKELMKDKASEEELRKNQESNTETCGKEIKICGKSEDKEQKSEQNKEGSEQMIKDKKQVKENDRKDNNSEVSKNKDNENETNTHQKLKGVMQTAYQISKASKESRVKNEGSTDEVYQRKEKGTNRQSERKHTNYSQNETKVTETLKTRSISKEMNKSGDQLPTAQNSSDLEKKTKHEMPGEMHTQYVINMLKQEFNVGIVKDGFISNVKTPQKNKF